MSLLLSVARVDATLGGRGLFSHSPYQKLRRNDASKAFPPTLVQVVQPVGAILGHDPYRRAQRNDASTVFRRQIPTIQSFSATGTGGLVFAGAGTVLEGYVARAATGGLQFAGSATLVRGIVARAPTGTLLFNGTSPHEFVAGSGGTSFPYVGSGGIVFAGDAVTQLTVVTPPPPYAGRRRWDWRYFR